MSEQMEDWGPGPYENPALAGVSDELFLKAVRGLMPRHMQNGPTDDQIYRVADQWFKTGDNQLKPDGYYFRSRGTPTNVRGSDLIAFARALLDGAASRVCPECAGHGRVYGSQHSELCPSCATQPTGRKD